MKFWIAVLGALALAGCTGSGIPPEARLRQEGPDPLTSEPLSVAGLAREEPSPRPREPRVPPPSILPFVEGLSPGASSVSGVLTVTFRALVGGAPGEHEVALELVAPSQSRFGRQAQRIQGSPESSSHEVLFELPVAGTSIQQANLIGTWSARFLLDGEVLATHDFELTP